jgi:alpha,alpha-trehalase
VLARAVDERGVFTQRYGGKALDASVLLIPLFRFLPPDDKRVRNTVLAIADELRSVFTFPRGDGQADRPG